MQNFQVIVFIPTETYTEILKSALGTFKEYGLSFYLWSVDLSKKFFSIDYVNFYFRQSVVNFHFSIFFLIDLSEGLPQIAYITSH